jgi:hypothetical protein
MIRVWMLLLSFLSIPAMSAEFSHIKLKSHFKEYLTRPKLKSSGAKSMALRTSETLDNTVIESTLRSSLLGDLPSKSGWSSPIPIDGEESLLYEEIRKYLADSHESIGMGQVQQINLINRQFGFGVQNFSGFSWQRPFGVVQVYADRQVTPNLFGDNWLIQDTFTLEIEASTFIEKLDQAGFTEMSDAEINAFAGITFRRVYTYYHYATSYDEGLKLDFSKLFLPFTMMNQTGVERMGHEEIIKREDNWSAGAGGIISTPPLSNISFSGGILAEYSFQQATTVQSTVSKDVDAQRYKLNIMSKESKDVGATLGLQLDFFRLIQLSLLRYDLNYEYASGKEFTLAFNSPDWDMVKQESTLKRELENLLRGSGRVNSLEPFVIRLDESSSSSYESRASILLWGKLQKSKTEQIRVIKDDNVRVFFRNYSQSLKVIQNFWSRIFSAIVYRVLKLPFGASNNARYARQLTMEYEATHPQAANPKVSRVETSEQFSFVLTQSYDAAKTHRWFDRSIKKDVIWFVDTYTTLPKDYKAIVRSEQLRGPLRVESNLRIEQAGFNYFISLSEAVIFKNIANICDSEKKKEWINDDQRSRLLKKVNFGKENCVKNIGKKYLAFKKDYNLNYLQPSLTKFKNFLTSYYKKSGGLSDLVDLFHEENVFIHGRLQATTSQGSGFDTSFSSGQFRGLGVIDNFKRETGSRSPASIVSE